MVFAHNNSTVEDETTLLIYIPYFIFSALRFASFLVMIQMLNLVTLCSMVKLLNFYVCHSFVNLHITAFGTLFRTATYVISWSKCFIVSD